MGNIGLIFDVDDKKYLIFIEKKTPNKNIILGFDTMFKKKSIGKCFYLSSKLEFVDFEIGENFIYSKICLSGETILDYSYNMFWFSSKKYKILKQNLRIESFENFERDIVNNVSEIYNFFN